MSDARFELAIVVGDFHAVRHGDLAALRHALSLAQRCVVLVASAFLPRSPRNPFTWEERANAVLESLMLSELARVEAEPLYERFDAQRTAQDLQEVVLRHGGHRPESVLLVRRGDALSDLPPVPWTQIAQPPDGSPPAHTDTPPPESALRDLLFTSADPAAAVQDMRPHLIASSAALLKGFVETPDFKRLREEWQHIAAEKALWACVPYPVVLVTVDAVLRAAGHVLLIRRGRHPGKGLLAVPGGFLEPTETVLHAALRELSEETLIDLPEDALRAALHDVHVFDHPRRSQRGRVITHAHFFDLPLASMPAVRGGDDAAAAEWVAQNELPALRTRFLDDHYLILQHFLGLPDTPH